MLKVRTKYIRIFSFFTAVGFVFISPFLLSQNNLGLNPQKTPSQYILKYWNTESGLSSESTNDIAQTEDGYIWIGTYTGLHRFDGKSFTIYTNQNSSLPSSNVFRMDLDTSGVLWIGTSHGVCSYRNNKFFVPKELESVKDYSIETILATKNNDIWFSTKSNHLFFYSKNKLINFTEEFKLTNSTVLTIEEAKNGTIYFGTDDSRLFSYFEGEIKQYHFEEVVNGVNHILITKKHVHIGTGNGLYSLTNDILSKEPFLQKTNINTLIEDRNNNLWVGTMRGLFRYKHELAQLDSLTETNGLPNNIIRDIIFDKQNNIWGATYRNGFFYLSDGVFTCYSKKDGLSSDIITAVTEIGENLYILGEESGKLNLLKNGKIYDYNPEIKLPKARLKHLFTDNKKRIWASTYAGLILLDGKNSRSYNISSGFPDNFIRLVYQDSKGIIWVGTKNAGLIKFKNRNEWTILNSDNGLSSNYIMSISENNKNQLIIGTLNGVNIIEDSKVIKTIYVKDGLPSNFQFSIYPTDNYLWISSNDGLTAYSDEKTIVFNTQTGLPSNILYNILPDKKGNLWLPSEKSVLLLNIKELERSAEFPDEKIQIHQFDKSHGMINSHCLGGVHSFLDSKGTFWIPTQGGLVCMNPGSIKVKKLKANLIIEGIYSENKLLPLSEKTVVPAGTSRLNIRFTGIDYKNTDKLQFRYKLMPFDKEWVFSSAERNAQYTNLPAGEYEFLLQVGQNNLFSENGKSKIIIIEAAWWQTIWAKILYFLIFLSIAYGLYLIRIRALKVKNKRLEAMVKTRTSKLEEQKQELSAAITNLSEAQDQLIQSEKMASLGVLSAGVAHEMNNPLNFIQGGLFGLESYYKDNEIEESEHIAALLSAIKEGISRATTIVSSLNEFSHQGITKQEKCSIHPIIENCLTMLQNKVKGKVDIIKDFEPISPIVIGNSGNLHQAFLNIILNAIHAVKNTGTIHITSRVEKNVVILKFKDTGLGIKPENITKVTEPFFTTKAPGEGTGLGLSITYKIIKKHDGHLTFTSNPKKGTTVTVSLPVFIDSSSDK